MYMFPACCFRQRIYVAQGLVIEVVNETWTHSCSLFELFSVGLGGFYIEVILPFSKSVFTLVCFIPLWYLICLSLCVCVCACARTRVGVVLGFTYCHFSSVCVCVSVCLGDFLCVEQCGFKFTGNSFLPFLCKCIRAHTHTYIYIYTNAYSSGYIRLLT